VCLDAKYVDTLAERLGAIPAPLGRYAVLGNHDLWTDYRHIEERLERAGITLLTNRNVQLPYPYDNVWICGLDDEWSGHPDPRAAFDGAHGARIVLMHAPSGLLDMNGERFDLALCGHTHGGQLALPGGKALIVPKGELSRRYVRGQFTVPNGGTLVVSCGVGCSTLPFRTFSPPDIIVCELTGSVGVPD
jgi:predicted MPP superfamily phosphohydrolase